MATDSRDRMIQDQPRQGGAEHKNLDVEQEHPQKKSDNADKAKEGMPGYGQPPEESRKPLPEQDW
jgi:hypothetical protein